MTNQDFYIVDHLKSLGYIFMIIVHAQSQGIEPTPCVIVVFLCGNVTHAGAKFKEKHF